MCCIKNLRMRATYFLSVTLLPALEALDGCKEGNRVSVFHTSDLAKGAESASVKEINELGTEPFDDFSLERFHSRPGTYYRLGTCLVDLYIDVVGPCGAARPCCDIALDLHRRSNDKERKKSEEKNVHVGKCLVVFGSARDGCVSCERYAKVGHWTQDQNHGWKGKPTLYTRCSPDGECFERSLFIPSCVLR
jgi:hypothetical protein